MYNNKFSDIDLFLFENLSNFKNIVHFITSRKGGNSTGTFKGLNIGFNSGDDNQKVLSNRHVLSNAVNIPPDNFTFANQTHSSNIAVIDNNARGLGFTDNKNSINDKDSLITATANICITIQVADCVPVFLYDSKKHVIAAVHAGWKGTVKQITGKTVNILIDLYGSKPGNIFAGIGPSIGPCCYETGENVYNEYINSDIPEKDSIKPSAKTGKYYFDLWEANRSQLISSGIKPGHIETASICTKCNNELFYSFRAAGGSTGRFAAGIMLK